MFISQSSTYKTTTSWVTLTFCARKLSEALSLLIVRKYSGHTWTLNPCFEFFAAYKLFVVNKHLLTRTVCTSYRRKFEAKLIIGPPSAPMWYRRDFNARDHVLCILLNIRRHQKSNLRSRTLNIPTQEKQRVIRHLYTTVLPYPRGKNKAFCGIPWHGNSPVLKFRWPR